jgi:Domain of unknown function (DUF4424)
MAWHSLHMKKFLISAAALAAFSACPTYANDSSAAIGLGGLELTRNEAISMDSEDLFLSAERVTVKYRFTNISSKDVETLVSFPLPAIPSGVDAYLGDQGYPDWSTDLEFKTLIDGMPVKLDVREVVTLIGKPVGTDVIGRLKTLGWPLKYWSDYKFQEELQDLPEAKKAAFIAEGLLHKLTGSDYVRPYWQVATHVTRTQRFAAGKTVTVEHSYKPVMGGSVGGMLLKQYRKDSSEYLKAHCVDKSFLKGFDARIVAQEKASKRDGKEYGNFYVEDWLSYVLKSGANWRGPIKDFRLVVDKGAATNMVSFCMDGVKKISPTQFEIRKTNFEPTRDLDILIVRFADPATW